jgi:ElaB/YqjD/DUF883 family membrane-anchored ribosome-binding protein
MDKIFDEKQLERMEKGMKDRLDKGVSSARDAFDNGKKVVGEKEEQMAEHIRSRPLEWVAGAFIAGLLFGKLLSRKD